MKCIVVLFFCILVPTISFARGYSSYSQGYSTHSRTPAYRFNNRSYSKRNSNIGGTHWVRRYKRRNGTVVQGHLSGNPGSGIHCHNNVCQ